MTTEIVKPTKCTEEYLEYLDALLESGATNMFGASPYLNEEFQDLSEKEAKDILVYWMKTFTKRKSKE
jgi:hypothetical protein